MRLEEELATGAVAVFWRLRGCSPLRPLRAPIRLARWSCESQGGSASPSESLPMPTRRQWPPSMEWSSSSSPEYRYRDRRWFLRLYPASAAPVDSRNAGGNDDRFSFRCGTGHSCCAAGEAQLEAASDDAAAEGGPPLPGKGGAWVPASPLPRKMY